METMPFFNQTLFEKYIQNLNSDIQDCAYKGAIHDATIAIDHIRQNQLFDLLDFRARALSLQCQVAAASDDAETMIQYKPKSAAGYIRLGNIYSMYGYHQDAIKVYKRGLQTIKSNQFTNGEEHDSSSCIREIQKLESCQKNSIALINQRVDIVSRLPLECVCIIISFLSMEEKATCAFVNHEWRLRIFDCILPSTWENFTVKEEILDEKLAKMVPYFSNNIKRLAIDTANNQIIGAYLKGMADGYLKKIHQLKTTPKAAPILKRNKILFFNALKTTNTLRHLDIDIRYKRMVVELTEILLACKSVSKLSYHMSNLHLASQSIGDFSILDQHNALIDFELNSSCHIEGEYIEGILQRCPNLRRFVVTQCTPSIIDAVITYGSRLKIFAYNACSCDVDIPDLSSPGFEDDYSPGLKLLVASSTDIQPVSNLQLLPLIYMNRTTLTMLHLDITEISEAELRQVNAACPEFKFLKLESFGFSGLPPRIYELLLGAIYDAATLRTLSSNNILDMGVFIKSVQKLPLLSALNMKRILSKEQDDLIQLPKVFASRSIRGLVSLSHISLGYFPGINDTVLCSFANIETLESVTLTRLISVSTFGIIEFIRRTRADQLKSIRFILMEMIEDSILAALCPCNALAHVELVGLYRITKEGLHYLLDYTKSIHLTQVEVKNCGSLTNTVYKNNQC